MKLVDVLNWNTVLEFTKSQKVLNTKITFAQERVKHKKVMKLSVKKGEETYLNIKYNKFEIKRICA